MESRARGLVRGSLLGLAFGLAVSTVDLAFVGVGLILRRMGPGPGFLLRTALLEITLAVLIGALGSPLLRLRVWRLPGSALVLAWLVLSWVALGWIAPFESGLTPMLRSVPFAALVLVLLGLALARWRSSLPWALGVVLLLAAIGVPQSYVAATTPERPADRPLPPAAAGAPDVVLVVLDTVRASDVSAYGYARPTTPTLAALAREGALFGDATAPSTWSLPSHASLFTGRYPSSHGAHGEHVSLDDRFPTIAQVLAENGYQTFCFTSNAWISDGLGLTRGFGWQDGSWREDGGAGRNFVFVHRLLDRLGFGEHDKGGARVAANFAAWAAARPPDARPAFVFLNFIEAHFPYHQLPRDYVQRFTDRPLGELGRISMALMAQQFGGPKQDADSVRGPAIDMYDAGIVYADELLRRVMEALRARGTLDRTLLVVTADHGELMGERADYFGHGASLYQPVVSVPLVLRYPPAIPAGTRVDLPVSTVGIFGTIAELAGIESPPTLQVPSLVPLVRGGSDAGPVLVENMAMTAMGPIRMEFDDPQLKGDVRYRGFRAGSLKLVETSAGQALLYDLSADPGELHDLASERPDLLARVQAELEATRVALQLPRLDADLASTKGSPELDEATLERLRELGYVE